MAQRRKRGQDWSKLFAKKEIVIIAVIAFALLLLLLLLSMCTGPATGGGAGAVGAAVFQKQVDDAFTVGNPYKGGSTDQ